MVKVDHRTNNNKQLQVFHNEFPCLVYKRKVHPLSKLFGRPTVRNCLFYFDLVCI